MIRVHSFFKKPVSLVTLAVFVGSLLVAVPRYESGAQSTAADCGLCVTAPAGTSAVLSGLTSLTVTGGGVGVESNGAPALSLAGSAKTAVSENAANGAPFASGWTLPAATKNVASVGVATTNGAITITYDAAISSGGTLVVTPVDGSVASGVALVGTSSGSTVPTAGSISWICKSTGSTNANSAAAAGTIADKYVPASCRT